MEGAGVNREEESGEQVWGEFLEFGERKPVVVDGDCDPIHGERVRMLRVSTLDGCSILMSDLSRMVSGRCLRGAVESLAKIPLWGP